MQRWLTFAFALIAGCMCVSHAHAQTVEKNDYSDPKTWLCRPGRQDACAADQTTTIVGADGTLNREEWKANPNAPIDCFYVYPTVSVDPGGNSDMTAGPEENGVVLLQLARFASQCKVYAPLYRQATLTYLRSAATANPIPVDFALIYNDVREAWHSYLERDNNGRGVVLIGHSQGSGLLIQLIRDEIDGKALQSRIVSAIVPGANLAVPKGKDVGGAFQSMRLCHAAADTGCVIAYVSFRSTIPPPANSRFGRVRDVDMQAACVNPAALGGGKGDLHAYFSSRGRSIVAGSAAEQGPWVNPPKPIDTPFVSVPGLLTAECVANDKESYLEVTVHGNPADPRTDEITGDVITNGQVNASWGLHAIDVGLTIGNLVDIVRQQAASFLAAGKTK